MNRAERRRRTRNKQTSRVKEWDYVYQVRQRDMRHDWMGGTIRSDEYLDIRHTGQARDRSPFDCGRTACFVCSRETGDHIGRQAARQGSIDDELTLDRLMSHE